MVVLPNGTGETIGDSLAITRPLQVAGQVWYVLSTTGTDAASPSGRDKQLPLATLAQAQTNASAGDIIVCLNGHTETLTGALTISKALTIIGCGSNFGKPGVQFKINAAATGLFIVSASGVELRNLYFPAAVQSNTNANGKVYISATADVRVRGCLFESSANDQLASLNYVTGGTGMRIENTTFISTATTTATRPTIGLATAGTQTDFFLDGVVFSDGTVGYSTACCDLSTGIISRIKGEGISQLLGADIKMNSSSTGYLNISTSTDGGRIAW